MYQFSSFRQGFVSADILIDIACLLLQQGSLDDNYRVEVSPFIFSLLIFEEAAWWAGHSSLCRMHAFTVGISIMFCRF